jgi:hypothetical protein
LLRAAPSGEVLAWGTKHFDLGLVPRASRVPADL